ncbi:MAG TPA: FAD-dependent oxidoreductase [Flavisolibacter sp.]
MQQKLSLKLLPSEAADQNALKAALAAACSVPPGRITGHIIHRQSIDARSRAVWVQLTVTVFIDEPYHGREPFSILLPGVHGSRRSVLIIGAGPAGLFAALRLIELGIRPIILERGKDVRSRRRDLAAINKQGIVNPESNYCFGEGGAGTYSDGKLYTRSTKRGDINRILGIFFQFGAEEKILYEAHPHIGTNKLPGIISAMRETIIAHGGEVHFEKKVTGLLLDSGKASGVKLADGSAVKADAVILATGHSARDIFQMLHDAGILIEAKPFALGVRVEHPQELIDSIQYHVPARTSGLPPASYSIVEQVNGKGVFSFCMCPGGIIAPAATSPGEIVVNGWSPSKRNNPYANSGIVVTVDDKNMGAFSSHGPLAGMYLQQSVEQKAFAAGGGRLVAPAQRLVDFTNNVVSGTLPGCSYLPGIRAASLEEVLPGFVHESLRVAFREFGKKMKGYFTNDAVVVATESRTSSPVRVPRNESLQHPQVENLYPCAEGAGYAGGIVSAAMDGERVASAIAEKFGIIAP